MSILDFFRSKKKSINSEDSVVEYLNAKSENSTVSADLFIDNQQPAEEVDESKQSNPLDEFMSRNYEWNGYNDGYENPDSEYLERKLRLIRSDFRIAIDKCIDIRRNEVGELRLHLIQTKGISDRLELQLNERIRHIEELVNILDTQKILSIEDEGFVSSAIQSYRIGFIKGLEKYQQNKLFVGNSGLFN
jgi:ethanolamine utilization cobalamin adenosyltransferase